MIALWLFVWDFHRFSPYFTSVEFEQLLEDLSIGIHLAACDTLSAWFGWHLSFTLFILIKCLFRVRFRDSALGAVLDQSFSSTQIHPSRQCTTPLSANCGGIQTIFCLVKPFFVGIETIPHAPYSPDLAPSDLWLFESFKNALHGEAVCSKKSFGSAIFQGPCGTPKESIAKC